MLFHARVFITKNALACIEFSWLYFLSLTHFLSFSYSLQRCGRGECKVDTAFHTHYLSHTYINTPCCGWLICFHARWERRPRSPSQQLGAILIFQPIISQCAPHRPGWLPWGDMGYRLSLHQICQKSPLAPEACDQATSAMHGNTMTMK